MKEIWKKIDWVDGYSISSSGRLLSEPRTITTKRGVKKPFAGGIRKPSKHTGGYMVARIPYNGRYKTVYIHRLVAEAFLKKSQYKNQVNHIDGNKENNTVENLEWVTQSENCKHSYDVLGRKKPIGLKGKYHPRSVPVLQIGLDGLSIICKYESQSDASNATGISRQEIGKVCLGKRVTAGGYKWAFA